MSAQPIHSFIHSFTHSLTHSWINSFMRSEEKSSREGGKGGAMFRISRTAYTDVNTTVPYYIPSQTMLDKHRRKNREGIGKWKLGSILRELRKIKKNSPRINLKIDARVLDFEGRGVWCVVWWRSCLQLGICFGFRLSIVDSVLWIDLIWFEFPRFVWNKQWYVGTHHRV